MLGYLVTFREANGTRAGWEGVIGQVGRSAGRMESRGGVA